MARYNNGMYLEGGFNIKSAQPIDSRSRVEYENDIIDAATWSGEVKPYKGMLVSVIETGNLYILQNESDVTKWANWGLVYGKKEIDKHLTDYEVIEGEEAEAIMSAGTVEKKYLDRLGRVFLISNGDNGSNQYKEYCIAQKKIGEEILYTWELLGDREINLSGYTTQEMIDEMKFNFSAELTTHYTTYVNNEISAVNATIIAAKQELEQTQEELDGRLTQATQDLNSVKEEVDNMPEEIGVTIDTKISAAAEILEEKQNELEQDLTTAKEDIAAIPGMLQEVKDDFEDAQEGLQAALNGVTENVGTLTAQVEENIGKISHFGDYIDVSAVTYTSFESTINALSGEMIDRMTTIGENSVTEAKHYTNTISGQVLTEVSRITDDTKQQIGQEMNAMEASVKTYAENLNISGMTEVHSLIDAQNGIIEEYAETVDTLESSTTRAINEINTSLGQITTEIEKIEPLSGKVTSLGQEFNAFSAEITTYAETKSEDAYTRAEQKINAVSGTIVTEAVTIARTEAGDIASNVAGTLVNAMGAEVKSYAETVSESAYTRASEDLNAMAGEWSVVIENMDARISAITEAGIDVDVVEGIVKEYVERTSLSGITELESRVDLAEEAIVQQGTKYNTLDNTMTSVQSRLGLAEASIIDHAEYIDATNSAITEVESELNAKLGIIRDKVETELSGMVKTMGTEINALSGTIITEISRLNDATGDIRTLREDFNESAGTITQSITDITKDGGVLDTRIEQSTTGISQTVSNLRTNLENLSGTTASLSGSTVQEISRIEQSAREIALGVFDDVTSAQIVAKINDSGESSAMIKADKILINGDTAVDGAFFASIAQVGGVNLANGAITNGYFNVDADGNVSATSAYIAGEIVADSGNIGNVGINTVVDGVTYPLYTENFSVDEDGYLKAKDANIEGKITADEGEIGGFVVSGDTLWGMADAEYNWYEYGFYEGDVQMYAPVDYFAEENMPNNGENVAMYPTKDYPFDKQTPDTKNYYFYKEVPEFYTLSWVNPGLYSSSTALNLKTDRHISDNFVLRLNVVDSEYGEGPMNLHYPSSATTSLVGYGNQWSINIPYNFIHRLYTNNCGVISIQASIDGNNFYNFRILDDNKLVCSISNEDKDIVISIVMPSIISGFSRYIIDEMASSEESLDTAMKLFYRDYVSIEEVLGGTALEYPCITKGKIDYISEDGCYLYFDAEGYETGKTKALMLNTDIQYSNVTDGMLMLAGGIGSNTDVLVYCWYCAEASGADNVHGYIFTTEDYSVVDSVTFGDIDVMFIENDVVTGSTSQGYKLSAQTIGDDYGEYTTRVIQYRDFETLYVYKRQTTNDARISPLNNAAIKLYENGALYLSDVYAGGEFTGKVNATSGRFSGELAAKSGTISNIRATDMEISGNITLSGNNTLTLVNTNGNVAFAVSSRVLSSGSTNIDTPFALKTVKLSAINTDRGSYKSGTFTGLMAEISVPAGTKIQIPSITISGTQYDSANNSTHTKPTITLEYQTGSSKTTLIASSSVAQTRNDKTYTYSAKSTARTITVSSATTFYLRVIISYKMVPKIDIGSKNSSINITASASVNGVIDYADDNREIMEIGSNGFRFIGKNNTSVSMLPNGTTGATITLQQNGCGIKLENNAIKIKLPGNSAYMTLSANTSNQLILTT